MPGVTPGRSETVPDGLTLVLLMLSGCRAIGVDLVEFADVFVAFVAPPVMFAPAVHFERFDDAGLGKSDPAVAEHDGVGAFVVCGDEGDGLCVEVRELERAFVFFERFVE